MAKANNKGCSLCLGAGKVKLLTAMGFAVDYACPGCLEVALKAATVPQERMEQLLVLRGAMSVTAERDEAGGPTAWEANAWHPECARAWAQGGCRGYGDTMVKALDEAIRELQGA